MTFRGKLIASIEYTNATREQLRLTAADGTMYFIACEDGSMDYAEVKRAVAAENITIGEAS